MCWAHQCRAEESGFIIRPLTKMCSSCKQLTLFNSGSDRVCCACPVCIEFRKECTANGNIEDANSRDHPQRPASGFRRLEWVECDQQCAGREGKPRSFTSRRAWRSKYRECVTNCLFFARLSFSPDRVVWTVREIASCFRFLCSLRPVHTGRARRKVTSA